MNNLKNKTLFVSGASRGIGLAIAKRAAQDGANTLTISPNANDGILYAGSLTDNKDLINTKATSKVGDFVVIASLNSTAHWTVVDAQGVFAKEA